MSGTVKITYRGKTTTIKAENRDGRFFSKFSEVAKPCGDVKVDLKGLINFLGKTADAFIISDNAPGGLCEKEFDTLCRITQAEAGGEDIKGRILVVNVIMNRVRSDSRDFRNVNTVTEVINQTNQFEPMRNGAFDRAVVSDGTREAATRALNGEDYSQGATFFRSVRGLEGSWHERALRHLFTHGGHAFFVPH